MAVHLLEAIEAAQPEGKQGYAGAVFLTYTLNLAFFEQMISPALDRSSVSNALVLADPDGYYDALSLGIKSLRSVGRRYVCAPLHRPSRGIQHSKLLLMADAEHGRLLVGSGNLTMYGYGRNLELFSRFDYDVEERNPAAHYAFVEAWAMIERFSRDGLLSSSAEDQISLIRDKARWLREPVSPPLDFRLWHSYDRPIWARLQSWRREADLEASPVRSLRVISPYYDREGAALRETMASTRAPRVETYLDPRATNLDGASLSDRWQSESVLTINALESSNDYRPLHAKAIIGVEENGSWCLSGSANMTYPALLKSWTQGGNLEMVTFSWSPDAETFEYLLNDPMIACYTLDADDVIASEEEPSERSIHVTTSFVLHDVACEDEVLYGTVQGTPTGLPADGSLELLRSGSHLSVQIDEDGYFECSLPTALQSSDAAILHIGEAATLPRWIDLKHDLRRFGSRTYHARIEGQLESFSGAESLFKDLLDFLWNQVDPAAIQKEREEAMGQSRQRSYGGASDIDKEDEDAPPVPAAEEFITEEQLIWSVRRRVRSQAPYDRDTYSLRELLSLVLLRLSVPTTYQETYDETGSPNEAVDAARTQDQEEQREAAQRRLAQHVSYYCRRYGRRLADPHFVEEIGAELLFQNHVTLARVLLEFAKHCPPFEQRDLRESFWWVWAPLAWPDIIGLESEGVLNIVAEKHGHEQLRQLWTESGLAGMTMVLLNQVFDAKSQRGAYDGYDDRIAQHLFARGLLERIQAVLGPDAFDRPQLGPVQQVKGMALGQQSLSESLDQEEMDIVEQGIQELLQYYPPLQKKIRPFIKLDQLRNQGREDSPEVEELKQEIRSNGLGNALSHYLKGRLPLESVAGEPCYCPSCFIKLSEETMQKIKRGAIVSCSSCHEVLLYWQPELPTTAI